MTKNDFYSIFKSDLTPKEMLELGVFGGTYFGDKIDECPKSWFKKAKLSKKFDVKLNRFRIKAGLSRKEWQDKGWIFKKIHLYGFNGTVGIQMDDEFQKLMKFKSKGGKILLDT